MQAVYTGMVKLSIVVSILAIVVSILATKKKREPARPEVKSGGSWEGKDVTHPPRAG